MKYQVAVVLFWVAIVLVIVILFVMGSNTNREATLDSLCVRAGYADVINWRGQSYCIGYKDGEIRVLDTEMLKAE